jgi:hypothetical protein
VVCALSLLDQEQELLRAFYGGKALETELLWVFCVLEAPEPEPLWAFCVSEEQEPEPLWAFCVSEELVAKKPVRPREKQTELWKEPTRGASWMARLSAAARQAPPQEPWESEGFWVVIWQGL